MKKCFKCKEYKDHSEFYKHPQMADGLLGKCKECTKRDVRKHRFENDSVREYDTRRHRESRERQLKNQARAHQWRKDNPEAYKAHTVVKSAIRNKTLFSLSCEICGEFKTHAHHEDYSKPLEVKWLCAKHHARHHN